MSEGERKPPVISVAIVDDDQDIRDGLGYLIDGASGFSCIGTFADGESAVQGILDIEPQVVLMDIQLPGISGIECVRMIKDRKPDLDVIMLTVHENDHIVFQSLRAGASGYLTKKTPPAKVLEAIREVNDGGAPMSTNIARLVVGYFQETTPQTPLTARETDVLDCLGRGMSYKMIADELFISQDTVRSHIKNIYRKLEVHSKSEAVVKALRERWISPHSP